VSGSTTSENGSEANICRASNRSRHEILLFFLRRSLKTPSLTDHFVHGSTVDFKEPLSTRIDTIALRDGVVEITLVFEDRKSDTIQQE
jgi:hypothetical protein